MALSPHTKGLSSQIIPVVPRQSIVSLRGVALVHRFQRSRCTVLKAARAVGGFNVGDDDEEQEGDNRRNRRRGGRGDKKGDRPPREEKQRSEFNEQIVQVSRVTKVVKGGKQLSFRAVVVVGNEKGTVRFSFILVSSWTFPCLELTLVSVNDDKIQVGLLCHPFNCLNSC